MVDVPKNPDTDRFRMRLDAFHELDGRARIELAVALVSRRNEARREEAFNIVRAQLPSVAEDLARSLAFHAYQELPEAVINLLAWTELNLRAGVHERHAGLDFDVRYHLYNWIQAEALVPYGSRDVFEDLSEIKECLAGDDKESAVAILDSLIERFEASVSPPDVDS